MSKTMRVQYLQQLARENRKSPTWTEKLIWGRVRNKKVCGVRFHRQKPILDFILDFYCPKARLCVEIDGDDHDPSNDAIRDSRLGRLGILTLRFANREVVKNCNGVMQAILETVSHRCATKPTETVGKSIAESIVAT